MILHLDNFRVGLDSECHLEAYFIAVSIICEMVEGEKALEAMSELEKKGNCCRISQNGLDRVVEGCLDAKRYIKQPFVVHLFGR